MKTCGAYTVHDKIGYGDIGEVYTSCEVEHCSFVTKTVQMDTI